MEAEVRFELLRECCVVVLFIWWLPRLDSQGLCSLILMGEKVVCVHTLEEGKQENNEESRTELKRDYDQCVADTEPHLSPNKKQAKEVSNDEVRSEVSNPNVSAAELAQTFPDISIQPTESENVNHAECGELTSTCLENSSSDETLSDEAGEQNNNNNNNNTSQSDKDTINMTEDQLKKHKIT